MPNKNNTSSDEAKVNEISERSRFKHCAVWVFKTGIKLFIVMSFTLFIYSIYLDGKIRKTFDGQRWKVPVQVYGDIITFKKGQKLDLKVLPQTLASAKYRLVTTPKRPGEFSIQGNNISIYRQFFSFGEHYTSESIINITLNNQHITALKIDGAKVKTASLEPFLLERMVPSNKEDRVLTSLELVPEMLLDTLILVEDRDFYHHSGISPLGILRAFISNIKAGRTVQGGSTLTQQLVKNMFLTRQKTLWRKVNEAVMSVILEYRYSKDLLLEAYLNEVYLGQHYDHGIYGFGLASEFYFGHDIGELTPAQIALLIGVVKGPSYYDPWRYPSRAQERRDIILQLMFQQHFLSKDEYVQAVESSLSIRKTRRLPQEKNPAYIQLVKRELAEHLSQHEQQSGVRVFTGFSLYMQHILTKSVQTKIPLLEQKYHTEKLEAAMIVTDTNNGNIKAIMGGKRQGYAGFNRALNAYRPIGSLIKPIIYLAALERYEQYNLATLLEDKPITLKSTGGREWSPKNYDGKYQEQVLLVDALSQSLNIPTVNLGMQLGLERVTDAILMLDYPKSVVERPSMLLGAINMSPLEVNQLYLTIAAQGKYRKGHVISHILSDNEETLWEFEPPQVQLISEQGAYLLDYALTQVPKTGTARSLTWRIGRKTIAGKTGTTNDQRDSWYVGYDNQYLVTTWLGRDDNKATPLTGSSGALLLYAEFMQKYGISNKIRALPNQVNEVAFHPDTAQPIPFDCENTRVLPVINYQNNRLKSCESLDNKSDIKKNKKEPRSWFERLFGFG